MTIPRKEGVEHNEEDDTLSKLQLIAQQRHAMEEFWKRSQEEIDESRGNHELILPVESVKNIIHAEEEGMMLSDDTPTFVTKLCELFVQELILRAWVCANSQNRDTILDIDIAQAIATTKSFHFLSNVVSSHRAQGGTIPDTDVSIWKSQKLDQTDTICHPLQAKQVSHLPGYPPHIPACPPSGQIGTLNTPCPFEFAMQAESLLSGNKEKSPLNEVLVLSNKVSMNNSNAATTGCGDSSSDVAIVAQEQGEYAHPSSVQYPCPSLEHNIGGLTPVGHGHSISASIDANIKKQQQEEQNIDLQDAFLGEEIMYNESLEGSQMDVDLVFPNKVRPQ
uniref:Core Histone H2A/H2B/H3 domain-containing protein n=1 Tax=Leersia perrieri TaxID=77586 RepID=A0A0D9VWF7_9ORYZ